jgi:putative ABC transport system permease protein
MSMTVNGQPFQGQVFADPTIIGPAIAAGRIPTRPGEIAMGADTMHKLGVHLGDRVRFQPQSDRSHAVEATVVGQSVLVPPIFYQAAPGDGVAVPAATTRAAGLDDVDTAALIVTRFRDGEDVHRSLVRTADALGGYGNVFAFSSRDRTVVDGIGRVRTAPRALLVILAVLGLSALWYMLFVTTRRQLVDIVVLRVLGFTRAQVMSTTATQAIGIALVAVVIGVPIGVLGGRLAWQQFADYLRVVPDAVLPALPITVVLVTVFAAASLAAVPSGIRAARASAADVLRTEG